MYILKWFKGKRDKEILDHWLVIKKIKPGEVIPATTLKERCAQIKTWLREQKEAGKERRPSIKWALGQAVLLEKVFEIRKGSQYTMAEVMALCGDLLTYEQASEKAEREKGSAVPVDAPGGVLAPVENLMKISINLMADWYLD